MRISYLLDSESETVVAAESNVLNRNPVVSLERVDPLRLRSIGSNALYLTATTQLAISPSPEKI
jgi:hypothetical protein